MISLPSTLCYLNGDYTPLNEAKVSVMDRGFIFGDGVYEVLPSYQGKIFCFERHMSRLERSLKELRIPNPHSSEEWLAIARQLLAYGAQAAQKPLEQYNQMLYIQITRGVAVKRDHVMPAEFTPTVFMTVNPLPEASAAQRAEGLTCVTADDFRWQKAHIKTTSLLPGVLARQISADVDAAETILFRADFLSEGAASNVWIVKDGQVMGPPPDNLVLQGIRYGLIEELCQSRGIPFQLRRISRAEVLQADEILLSSATKEVIPVTRLDNRAVGTGIPGPIYTQLYDAYQDVKTQKII